MLVYRAILKKMQKYTVFPGLLYKYTCYIGKIVYN